MTKQGQSFIVSHHNIHYEGAYSERRPEWRRLGAVDKCPDLAVVLTGLPVNSVLEVGCGAGPVLADVASQDIGAVHSGVDKAVPQSHRDDEGSAVNLSACDGVKHRFAGRHLDLVFASHGAGHVPDPKGFLREISRLANDCIDLRVLCNLNVRTTRQALQRPLDIGHIRLTSSCQVVH